MQHEEREITVAGKGETLQRAFQDALNAMRKELLQGRVEALLNADPIEVEVLEAVRATRTEKFFGLFFQRERQTYRLKIRFRVRVSFVDLAAIPVKQVHEDLNATQRILQLK